MNTRVLRAWPIWSLLLASLVVPAASGHAQIPDRDALIQLNRQLLESVFLRQDTTLLAATALPDVIVIPPGGVVEKKPQVIAGVRNVAMDSVIIDDVTVVGHGATAVVVARVMGLGGRRDFTPTGRTRIMNVFVYDQQRWRLLARSITPCIERAVTAGRC